jgi:phage baseplate assembly protein W
MSVLDFKSVGVRTRTLLSSSQEFEPTPIGIMTPLRLGDINGGIFGMYTSLQRTLNDNFRNLLLTNHGERLAIHDFGANLQPLTMDMSEYAKDEFDAEAVIRIKTSTNKYMPFLDLTTFESTVDHHDNKSVGKIKIRVEYNIPRLNLTHQAQEIILFVGG